MAPQKDWHFDKEEQRRLKRVKLLKASAGCFNQKGFSGTSLKDVAKILGISDAAIYYYVKNKEELVNLCYIRALDLGEAALQRAEKEGSTALERLILFLRYQIDEVCGDDGPVAIMSEIPALKPEHRAYILNRSTRHTKEITRLIKSGIADGSMSSPNPIASCDAILGALNWIPKWYKPDSNLSSKDIADAFIHTFTQGLTTR
ncbi:MAG: TetR/AcrR family transcriptional regulator [Anaerolineales bacterium]|nr:MAG: TetR/AcrR family transcriptional regulator [Anaerolineales bacterium]